jgi:ABC-type amino acid transport substrate-binding protein
MRSRYRSIILIASFVALLGTLSCDRQAKSGSTDVAPTSTLHKIQQAKLLRVAFIHYPPSAFRGTDGKVTGHFVNTLEEIIHQLDPAIKLEYEETTWVDFTTALTSGRVDLSIAGTFTTVPRAKVVAFTRPLVYLGRSAIVKKGDARFSPSESPLQFDRPDIKVAVVSGEGSHEFVKTEFKHLEIVTVFSGADLSQALAAVSAGQVDVGMSDALETQKYARVHPEVTDLYAERPYNLTPIAWAVRQEDHEWKDFLDTAIHLLEAQGKLQEFEAKYDFKWTHPVVEYRSR